MCRQCFVHFGSPTVNTPEVRRLAKILAELPARVRDGDRAYNIDDAAIDNALMWARWSDAEYDWFVDMRRLSLLERASILGLADGFWGPAA